MPMPKNWIHRGVPQGSGYSISCSRAGPFLADPGNIYALFIPNSIVVVVVVVV